MKYILFILLLFNLIFSQVVFRGVMDEDVDDSARQSIGLQETTDAAVGDLLIAIIGKDDDVAITHTSSFTELVNVTSGTGNAFYVAWILAQNRNYGHQFTSTDGNEDWVGWLLWISGNDATNPIHAYDDSTGTSDTPYAPEVSYTDLANASNWVVFFGADDNDTPYILPAGTGQIFKNNNTDTGGAGGMRSQVTISTSGLGVTYYDLSAGGNSMIGQSFNGGANDLTNFRVRGYKEGTFEGDEDVVASLWSHSGTYGSTGVPDTELARSDTIPIETWTGTLSYPSGWFTDNTYTLSAGTKYFLVFETMVALEGDEVIHFLGTAAGSQDGNYAYYDGSWNYGTPDINHNTYENAIKGTGAIPPKMFTMDNSEQWASATVIIESNVGAGTPPTGWTGTFMGVTDPSIIMGVDVENLQSIMGVE